MLASSPKRHEKINRRITSSALGRYVITHGTVTRRLVMKSKYHASSLFTLALMLAMTLSSFAVGHSLTAHADSLNEQNVDIWWPVQNVVLSGSHPFKAMLRDRGIGDYTMYWSVDGGQKNAMADSYQDYPHKEVVVNFEGWTWKGSGPYTISISAFDRSGKRIAERSVQISIRGSVMPTPLISRTPVPSVSVAPLPTPSVVSTPTPSVSMLPTPSALPSTTPVIAVVAPTSNQTLVGTQKVRAFATGLEQDAYMMYWQVDGDRLNPMYDAGIAKEATIDFTGWKWKGSGPYSLTFIARNLQGSQIGSSTVNIFTGSTTPLPSLLPVPTPSVSVIVSPTPTPTVLPTSPSVGNSLSGTSLWVNENNEPARWVRDHQLSDPANAALMGKIASQPEVQWFGNWNSNVEQDVRNTVNMITNAGKLPVFVVYNIPQRDCGGYSAGGSNRPDAYKAWIRSVAAGIGGKKATVLVEPDALVGMDCLSPADQQTRVNLIKDAVQVLKATGNASIYIDAGHPAWKSASGMAEMLKKAGIDQAEGFSLNVSNFRTTADNISYGTQISQLTGGKHFVIDTGRNGNGPAANNEWCNPWGRALGEKPTTNTGKNLVDAYLWVRGPSGSDGQCNGGPSAGTFWPAYGLDLAKNTPWW